MVKKIPLILLTAAFVMLSGLFFVKPASALDLYYSSCTCTPTSDNTIPAGSRLTMRVYISMFSDCHSVKMDWGRGEAEEFSDPSSYTFYVEHLYDEPGAYTIQATLSCDP